MSGDIDYIRFAALGDSATFGIGDPVAGGSRGWARLLADAIATTHHVSFCNLARPGATVHDVRHAQLDDALAHQPAIASLVVGLNDVMRTSWDPHRIHDDLLECARALVESGAVVITARFHDHGRAIGLPRWLSRPLFRRTEVLNEIFDDVHERYGTLRVDLASDQQVFRREFWAADRLHPSELGHRHLAARAAELLMAEGLPFEPPSLTCTQARSPQLITARNVLIESVPWMARRLKDWTPWVAGIAADQVRLKPTRA